MVTQPAFHVPAMIEVLVSDYAMVPSSAFLQIVTGSGLRINREVFVEKWGVI
jgi:hypothetical protein